MKSVALITGASRGIGEEVAKYFATKHYNLELIARDSERLKNIAESLVRNHNIEVGWHSVDVTEFDQVNSIVKQVIEAYGKIDVLVNAAGIFRFGTKSLSNGDLDELLNTNVRAVHNLCTACGEAMGRSSIGHIFNIASITGKEGFKSVGGYCASKFANVGYSQALAKELLPENIKVTTICPDVVNTDMAAGSGMAPEQMIDKKDIARTIDYVLSLSDAAVVDEVVVKCKTILEQTTVR